MPEGANVRSRQLQMMADDDDDEDDETAFSHYSALECLLYRSLIRQLADYIALAIITLSAKHARPHQRTKLTRPRHTTPK